MSKIFNTYIKEMEERMGLNKREGWVLGVLVRAGSPMAIKNIWEIKHTGRLTLLYNLKKLEKRGLIVRERSEKAHKWMFVRPTSTVPVGTNEHTNIRISIDEAYEILDASNQHKIIGIQGTGAVKDLVEGMKKKPEQFAKMHTRQKLRQVVVDAILTEDVVDEVMNLPEKSLRTHFGRPTVLHLIPRSSHISEYEVISDGKFIVIADHKKNEAIVVKDSLVVESVIALLETIKMGGVKKNVAEIYGIE